MGTSWESLPGGKHLGFQVPCGAIGREGQNPGDVAVFPILT